jgi:ribosomal protein S16
MHTVIRYNRRGQKLYPTYWMVVQGHYKNRRGKWIEHLGYWTPKHDKKKKEDRSIILNKSRARYWIAEGARVPYKLHRHMSYFGLVNEPWIKWGRKTVYPNEQREVRLRRGANEEFTRNHFDKVDEQRMREEEMENMLLRRVKLKQRLLEEFEGLNQDEVIDNLMMEDFDEDDEDDKMLRSTKYWALYKEYQRIESNPAMMHPLRKELLFKKLNSIAEKGFYEKERISFDNPYFSIFIKDESHIRTSPHADHLKREIEEDRACKIVFFCHQRTFKLSELVLYYTEKGTN